ncbi:MAG: acetolactate synthase small subunit, partial [Gammaproteobacteria bacterium]
IDLNDYKHIERELMLVKVWAGAEAREEVKRLVDIFRGRIIDVSDTTYIIELTGAGDKLNAFLDAMDKKHIVEVVRSGVTGICRAEKALHV